MHGVWLYLRISYLYVEGLVGTMCLGERSGLGLRTANSYGCLWVRPILGCIRSFYFASNSEVASAIYIFKMRILGLREGK